MDKQKILEEMNKFSSVSEALNYADQQRSLFPKTPQKPVLRSNHSVGEAEAYIIELKKYEKDIEEFKKELKIYEEDEKIIDTIIERYIKKHSGLYDIPDQYQEKVYSLAYEMGHSGGYHDIYNALLDLVDIFE